MIKNIDFGPVADLYDVYVQWDVDIPFFRQICATVTGPVLELMSGTGRLSLPLLRDGVRLTCIDYSAQMLNVLRERLKAENLTANVYEQDVRTLALKERFELALLPFHSLSEILDPNDRALALDAIRRHLTPGGRLILTLHNPVVQAASLDGLRHQLCERPIPGRDAVLRFWFTAHRDRGEPIAHAHQEYEIVGVDGRLLDTRELDIRFAIITHEEISRQVTAHGFEVLHLWGDYSLNPFQAATSPFMLYELRSTLS